MKKYWIGSKIDRCQITNEPLGKVMYDANVNGTWGNIGQKAFNMYGCKLGPGLGQKYEKQEDGKWLLVEGDIE